MAELRKMVAHLDEYLRLAEVADFPNAFNGLQMENSGLVSRIAAAVDGCEFTIRRAAEERGTLLLVHHGLFWRGVQPWRGALYRKLRDAIEGDLAVYSAHLPLDLHPDVGNNALLARALGMRKPLPFFMEKGQYLGLKSRLKIDRTELKRRLEAAVGGSAFLCAGGSEDAGTVGVVTGGAGGEIALAAAEGVDTFVTGEAPHWAYTASEEAGINLLLGGHYATETFGVKALAGYLSERFRIPWGFIDHPTGL